MREDQETRLLREALDVVEAALAGGAVRFVALPQRLPRDVARRLEEALRARGWPKARYREEPREWGVLEHLETLFGLDEDEPRVELD